MEEDKSIYEQLGVDNLKTLVDNFYDLVFENQNLKPLFTQSPKEVIKTKQFLFLTQFLGGPALYSNQFGHPKLRARHMPHKINEKAALEWLICMKQAIEKLPISQELGQALLDRFPPVAYHMINSEE